MSRIIRFAALWLVALSALTMVGPAPARADVISDYRAELDSLALQMRALWGEIDRFQIQQRYCLPPYGPVKQPDTMMMQAYSARAEALNDKYNALKQSLQDFLKRNTWAHGRLQVAGKDPNDAGWWARWDTSRDKMIGARNAKRAALARAPERDCAPRAKSAIAVQPPPPLALPQRPQIPPFNWPALPRHFCSDLEKLDWKIANINPQYLREAEVAHAVARYRAQVEGLVNDFVQAGKPIPPALAEARRQAIADVREMARVEKANADFYRRFAAIPVIDCSQGDRRAHQGISPEPAPGDPPRRAGDVGEQARPSVPGQTGQTAPSDPAMRTIFDGHNRERRIFGSPPLKWNPGLSADALAYARVLARTGKLVHAPREGRGAARENLSRAPAGSSAQQMIANWIRERVRFKPGTYPDVSTTGNWSDVAHYTQLVWPKTTEIGCGMAVGMGASWLVCRYLPGGNRDGFYIGNEPKIAGDIAPANSGTPTLPRDLPKLPIGGGMTQIDPPPGPPPPPPTAGDPAPNGDEARHPLRDYFMAASDQHRKALRSGDVDGQAEALHKMHYALQELVKRLREARKAGGRSGVKPADVKAQIDELNAIYRAANERSRPRNPGEERG